MLVNLFQIKTLIMCNVPKGKTNAASFNTAQKMKFSSVNEVFFSKFDQIYSFLRIWSHLVKKSLMENFLFCTMQFPPAYLKCVLTKACRYQCSF